MRTFYRCCLMFTALCGLTLCTVAADWPQFRGPDGCGTTQETALNTAWKTRAPKLLWKTPMADDGFAGPSVSAGRVYIIDHQGKTDTVRALDLATGKERWHYSYPDATSSNYGFSRSTPTVSGGKVYTISRLGKLFCFDAATGKVQWQTDMVSVYHGNRPQWDYAYSPFIDGKQLILCPGAKDGNVLALDTTTGKLRWKGGGNRKTGYATPQAAAIDGVRQYVIFTGDSLIGVACDSGKLCWQFPWKTGCDVNAAAPLVIDNHIFITSDYGHGCAMVNVAHGTATALWANKEMQAHFSSPVYYHGFIYGTGEPGYLMCLDPSTGKARWKTKGFEKGGVAGVGGALLAMCGKTGELVMVQMTPDHYQELGRFTPLGGQSWTAPVVAAGKLIVRNTKTLACYDLK